MTTTNDDDHLSTNRSPPSRSTHGFYAYSIAAEVFAVVGVGAFLPVTLEQLARENGVLYSDSTTPCIPPPSSSRTRSTTDPSQCLITLPLLHLQTTTSSFAMYTFSLAVLVQALTLISVSAFADYSANRRQLLLGFGAVGAGTSMAFIFVGPSVFWVGSVLVVIGVTCLGASFSVLNSFLPGIAAEEVQMFGLDGDGGGRRSLESVAGEISSRAVGLGYAAAMGVQVMSIGILAGMKQVAPEGEPTLPLRLILVVVGLWWAGFMVPTAMWLRGRPGPELKDKRVERASGRITRIVAYVRFAWSALFQTVKVAIRMKQMVIFLVAWFVISDAQASVSGSAVLFARTELGIGTIGIAILSITVVGSGVLGAFVIPKLAAFMRWNNTRTIVACLTLMLCVPIYGLLGYVPFVQSWGVGGLQMWWEIYPLGFVFGFVMAGLSSFCRACFGQMIPPGNEAAFFALFAITDKGSSAIGPAVIGRIVDATGNIRPAFWFLAVVVGLPIPFLLCVDLDEGRADAMRMAESLREQKGESFQLREIEHEEEAEGLMRDHE